MDLKAGEVAVVTGAASGIGLALAHRFAQAGLRIAMVDVEVERLNEAVEAVAATGAEAVGFTCDVRTADAVNDLATRVVEQFGGVQILCNNAGVADTGDPWFGPIESWDWVLGVNFYGVVHGVRAFLPHLFGGGHIINTASMAGLFPGLSPIYDASKHAVVALTENLYHQMNLIEAPIGVSCLCPGWVRTGIFDAERNWPAELGERPESSPVVETVKGHLERAIAEGLTPAAVADLVVDAVTENRFWVFPHPDWLEMAADRWQLVAEGTNPEPPNSVPGMPPRDQLAAEIRTALGLG